MLHINISVLYISGVGMLEDAWWRHRVCADSVPPQKRNMDPQLIEVQPALCRQRNVLCEMFAITVPSSFHHNHEKRLGEMRSPPHTPSAYCQSFQMLCPPHMLRKRSTQRPESSGREMSTLCSPRTGSKAFWVTRCLTMRWLWAKGTAPSQRPCTAGALLRSCNPFARPQ